MNISFARGAWTTDVLTYAYSYRFPETPVFIQNDDCVENAENPDATCMGYDFVTLMTRETYGKGTRVTTRCSFHDIAAPLLVFADKLDEDAHGDLRYGNYYEVVLWKNGINVWRLWRDESGEVVFHKRLGVDFPVEEDVIHTLSVELGEEELRIDMDERHIELRFTDADFERVHIGINACEGTCKFYSLDVE